MEELIAFISAWNSEHKDIKFFAGTEGGSVYGIHVRYTAVRYRDVCTHDNWERMNAVVQLKSHSTIWTVTGEDLFFKGIIDFAVACCNHNYNVKNVLAVLKWLSEAFFVRSEDQESIILQ